MNALHRMKVLVIARHAMPGLVMPLVIAFAMLVDSSAGAMQSRSDLEQNGRWLPAGEPVPLQGPTNAVQRPNTTSDSDTSNPLRGTGRAIQETLPRETFDRSLLRSMIEDTRTDAELRRQARQKAIEIASRRQIEHPSTASLPSHRLEVSDDTTQNDSPGPIVISAIDASDSNLLTDTSTTDTDTDTDTDIDTTTTDTRGETDTVTGTQTDVSGDPASDLSIHVPVEPPAEVLALRSRVHETLSYYHARPENVARRSPWGIMHAMIAFEVDSVVIADQKTVNALGWLCWNGNCAGQRLLAVNRGRLVTRNGPGVQGHEGQFLALLAQCGVRADNELRVGNNVFTVNDLVEYEKRTCRAGTELTFKLIGLSYYLDSEDEWVADDGSRWNIAKLIREELGQQVIGAACGGTHRMMGFSFAVQQRRLENRPIDGQWLRAQTFVEDFVEYNFRLQNSDGSFSTAWFEGRESRADIGRRIQTTGHIVEWLVYTLDVEALDDPRVVMAVDYLNDIMWDSRRRQVEIGPKGHALHALLLYNKKRFEHVADPTDEAAAQILQR